MIEGIKPPMIPKLVCVIIDRNKTGDLIEILREKHVHNNYVINGMGTASSEVFKAFGLSGTEKTIAICVVPEVKAAYVLTAVSERLELTRPGRGIVFISPISGVSAVIAHIFERMAENHHERFDRTMIIEEDRPDESGYELIVAIVNSGYSDGVMESARSHGARGGTIVHARRTGGHGGDKFFGITLQDEKEVIAILTKKEQRKELMQAISASSGIKTEARGIVFSLPVEDISGLNAEPEE